MTRRRCLACQDEEHDACNNLLWDAGCPCRHTRYPRARCESVGRNNKHLHRCDRPRYHIGDHKGRYWFIPPPVNIHTDPWWGWDEQPFTWDHERTYGRPPGRFDPGDRTAPGVIDMMEGVE